MNKHEQQFNPSELPPELGQFDHLSAMVDKADRNRIYGVDAEGRKTQLKLDDVYKAYGYSEEDFPESPDQWESLSDTEKLKEHANWQQKINTTRTSDEDLATSVSTEKNVKASENGLTTDDFRYNSTLKEMSEDSDKANKGRTLSQKVKDDKETQRKAELKKLANLRMRVKTGALEGLTADDVEYVMNQIDEDKKSIRTSSEAPKQSDKENPFASAPDVSKKKDSAVKENPFASAPDIKTRHFDKIAIDKANEDLGLAIRDGDKELFEKNAVFLRNEVMARDLIDGTDRLKDFDKFIKDSREKFSSKEESENRNLPVLYKPGAVEIINSGDTGDSDDQEEDLPPIKPPKSTNGDGNTGAGANASSPVDEEGVLVEASRKGSKKRMLAWGAAALAIVGLSALGYNQLSDDNSNANESEPTEEEVEPIEPSQDILDELAEIDAEAEDSTSNEETPSAEGIAAIEDAIAERTAEISDAEGSTVWAKFADVYGEENATTRLIAAVEALQADGVDAQWHGDPLTSKNAWISISDDPSVPGNSDVNFVTNRLAQESAEIDVANFLASLAELPETK